VTLEGRQVNPLPNCHHQSKKDLVGAIAATASLAVDEDCCRALLFAFERVPVPMKVKTAGSADEIPLQTRHFVAVAVVNQETIAKIRKSHHFVSGFQPAFPLANTQQCHFLIDQSKSSFH
jgi:hypothetical protein